MQVCAHLCMCMQVCAEVCWCIQRWTGVYRCVQRCSEVDSVQVCAEVCRCIQRWTVCAGVCRYVYISLPLAPPLLRRLWAGWGLPSQLGDRSPIFFCLGLFSFCHITSSSGFLRKEFVLLFYSLHELFFLRILRVTGLPSPIFMHPLWCRLIPFVGDPFVFSGEFESLPFILGVLDFTVMCLVLGLSSSCGGAPWTLSAWKCRCFCLGKLLSCSFGFFPSFSLSSFWNLTG